MNTNGTFTNVRTGLVAPCTIHLSGNRLHVYLKDKEDSLLIWDLRTVSSFNYGGNRAIVKQKAEGDETLEFAGEMAAAANAVYKNPVVEKASTRRPFVSYTPFFVFCGTALTVGLLVYFLLLPWLGRQAVKLVPMEMEIQMGDALAKQYSLQYSTSDSANYYANKFCSKLNLSTLYPVKIEVLKSNELNAFALPGGRIFIYSGMLEKMDSYEELVALIGHESSHVTHRHSLKTIMRSAATGMIISAVFGDISELSGWVLSRADEFKQLDYSRELETEADNEGYKIMLQNRIDPKGMLRLLELLKKEGTEMPAMMKYLSTHPDTEARIENVKGKEGLNGEYTKRLELETLFRKIKESGSIK